jgi:large subunit ribosomal protein L15
MWLNSLTPTYGARKKGKRLGRGQGSGKGKTCGRGHKGQSSRAGGYHKVGFEGGQMPLQRRIPKLGFTSRIERHTANIGTSSLRLLDTNVVTLELLKVCGLVQKNMKRARIFFNGSLERAINVQGLAVSSGAKREIEKIGGSIVLA